MLAPTFTGPPRSRLASRVRGALSSHGILGFQTSLSGLRYVRVPPTPNEVPALSPELLGKKVIISMEIAIYAASFLTRFFFFFCIVIGRILRSGLGQMVYVFHILKV